ncbi:MAG: tRNA (adenosine(37)-N6)-dimethylallyltransferase MiaA [Bacteroidales bacterium]|nr:tRNA (adenosine(37)-N6)-dimethylallyltransferase MiaA [Bacteroidales bacterium]
MKTLYIIAGPTASGKTSFAISLAKALNTEIISADSRQIFKEMNIGVARPSVEELRAAKHHLIATWSIFEDYNVARYEKECIEILERLFATHDSLVMCGGSGMYIDAIINGIDTMPDADKAIRDSLQKDFNEKGLEYLQKLLKEKDPKYYQECDIQNHRRVIRALEVCLQTNKPFSTFRKETKQKRDFKIKVFGLERDREELVERIDKRVDLMIKEGLEQETEVLLQYKHLNALNTVGYKELFDYFEGKISRENAIEQIKIHTRQYAKRQMTWFRKTENIQWLKTQNNTFTIPSDLL